MKRLTKRDEYGNADIIGVETQTMVGNLLLGEFNKVTEALNRLAEYEDLEEQGYLIKLPCKVGDKVYYNTQGVTETVVVISISTYHHSSQEPFAYTLLCTLKYDFVYLSDRNFGTDWFFTRAEAEKKLEEIKGE